MHNSFTQQHRFVVIALACVFLLLPFLATAQANPEINYQGKLTDSANIAVANGTYEIEFNLYTQPTGGSPVWTETLDGADEVVVQNGLFSVMLGSTTPLTNVDFNQTLYLGVTVEGDLEMTPRKILGSVPAAFVAREADNAALLGGVASTSFLRSDQADTASSLLTFSSGLISQASSTISNLTTLTATTTNLVINGERFTDLTGTGLMNNSGVLTLDTSQLNTLYASTTDFNTCTKLATILTGHTTGTCGSFVLSASPTFTGTVNAAALTLSSTLTLSGSAANIALGNNYLSGDGSDEGIFVDGDGKVGIGTSTPNSKLSVYGSLEQSPINPTIIGGVKDASLLNGATSVSVAGHYAYVANYSDHSLRIIDISNPTAPTIIGGVKDASLLNAPRGVTVVGRYAYVVNNLGDSLRIIDISDPTIPTIVGGIYDASLLNGAFSVTVAGGYAYVVNATDDSLRIIDISDPTAPAIVGGVKDASLLNGAYSIAVAGRYAYVANFSDDSLRIIDISDPTAPTIVGGVKDATNLSGPRSVAVAGRYAYVANSTDDSLRIIDISSSTAPAIIGGVKDASLLNGAWHVTVAGRYAYVANNTDDSLRIIDISSSTAPAIIGGVKDASLLDGARSVAVAGRYAYVANDTDDSLRIIDLHGTRLATAEIGSLDAGFLSVLGNGRIDQSLFVGSGLNVGQDAMIGGVLTITGNSSSSLLAANTNPAFIVQTGNVGIGTTTPSSKLTVQGNTWIGGNLTATGTLAITGHSTLTTASSTNLSVSGNSYLGTILGGTWNGSAIDISSYTNLGVTATGLSLSGDNIALAGAYTIPLTASTTEWSSFYTTPSTRITAGTGLTWSGNTINLDNDFGASIDESELNIAGSPTNGYLLQASSTATGGFAWVATSTLGIVGGGSSQWTTIASDIYYNIGNVGIGTTTPTSLLTVFETGADPQMLISYDATRFAEFQVDSVGDLLMNASGGDTKLTDNNLWICESGSCPSITASSTAGYAIVENGIYFGNGFKIDQIAGTTTEIGVYNASGSVIIIFEQE